MLLFTSRLLDRSTVNSIMSGNSENAVQGRIYSDLTPPPGGGGKNMSWGKKYEEGCNISIFIPYFW